MRNIFFYSRIAAACAIRDRNIAVDAHEPTFKRRIQSAVAFNFTGLCNLLAVFGYKNVQEIIKLKKKQR